MLQNILVTLTSDKMTSHVDQNIKFVIVYKMNRKRELSSGTQHITSHKVLSSLYD